MLLTRACPASPRSLSSLRKADCYRCVASSATNNMALLILDLFLRVKCQAFRKRMLRLIGVGAAGIGQQWIAVTSAAPAGGHRLALLHGLKAAGAHSGSDVLAAILTRARRRGRCHRDKRH